MIYNLLRVSQWYKNLLIYLPLIFIGQLFDLESLSVVTMGFICLCLISSVNYIINDILDREKDRNHPEKKNRPIASGKISVGFASFLAFFLFVTSGIISLYLSFGFFLVVMALFVLTQIYSFGMKNEPFADILMIGINFVLRAVSGTFLIDSIISPWLILCTFFLSLFLSSAKRHSDIVLMGENAWRHKKVLKFYDIKITGLLMILFTSLLVMSYALYSFLSQYPNLIWTLPLALYVILRYYSLAMKGDIIARHPERAILDRRLVLGVLFWSFLVLFIIYSF